MKIEYHVPLGYQVRGECKEGKVYSLQIPGSIDGDDVYQPHPWESCIREELYFIDLLRNALDRRKSFVKERTET